MDYVVVNLEYQGRFAAHVHLVRPLLILKEKVGPEYAALSQHVYHLSVDPIGHRYFNRAHQQNIDILTSIPNIYDILHMKVRLF